MRAERRNGRKRTVAWRLTDLRLSCGRTARGRTVRPFPADELPQRTSGILPYLAAPASSKRWLGGVTLLPVGDASSLDLLSKILVSDGGQKATHVDISDKKLCEEPRKEP